MKICLSLKCHEDPRAAHKNSYSNLTLNVWSKFYDVVGTLSWNVCMCIIIIKLPHEESHSSMNSRSHNSLDRKLNLSRPINNSTLTSCKWLLNLCAFDQCNYEGSRNLLGKHSEIYLKFKIVKCSSVTLIEHIFVTQSGSICFTFEFNSIFFVVVLLRHQSETQPRGEINVTTIIAYKRAGGKQIFRYISATINNKEQQQRRQSEAQNWMIQI